MRRLKEPRKTTATNSEELLAEKRRTTQTTSMAAIKKLTNLDSPGYKCLRKADPRPLRLLFPALYLPEKC